MSWLPLVAWLLALVVTVLVLSFCAYEITWKARRVQTELANLRRTLDDGLAPLRTGAAAAQQRLARARAR